MGSRPVLQQVTAVDRARPPGAPAPRRAGAPRAARDAADLASFGRVATSLEAPTGARRRGWVLAFVGGWLLSQVVGGFTYLAVAPAFSVRGTASGVRAAEVLEGGSIALSAGTPLVALALLQIPMWATQLAVVTAATTARGRSWRHDLGLRVQWSDLPVGAVAGVGAQLVIGVVYRLLDVDSDGPAQQLTSKGSGVAGLVGMLVLLAVCAPFVEELLFRGVLQGGLASQLPPVAALLGSSTIFGLVHFQAVQFPGLFVAGLVFGGLALRSDRLGPALVSHAFFNATTIVALWAG